MAKDLLYVIHHVFLPPGLPLADDSNPSNDDALIKMLLEALRAFQAICPSQEDGKWRTCVRMSEAMLEMQDQLGGLVAEKLQQKLQGMGDEEMLALHIRGQNAGIIVRRSLEQVSFVSFEIAPTNEAVTKTNGRLLRSFPGPAVVLNRRLLVDSTFCEPLVELLVKLDSETPDEVKPTVTKSGSETVETRDTIDPRFVTEMLTGMLRAVGHSTEVPRINKCTREEVLWDAAYMPWKRSALWLLLRVALQTSLMKEDTGSEVHLKYKPFMIFFMARILESALRQSYPNDLLFMMRAKIGRRVFKLSHIDQVPGLEYVEAIVNDVKTKLDKDWETIQLQKDPFATQRAWTPSFFKLQDDTRLTLSTLRPYLKTIDERQLSETLTGKFTPTCSSRISPESMSLPDSGLLTCPTGDQLRLCLADQELWVLNTLQAWLLANITSLHSCTALKEVLENYMTIASALYMGSPEDMSTMFLTSMELWIALDKCAVHHEPILQDYHPEFPPSLFDPLLLPKKHQMERLHFIETYLSVRKRQAKPFPSVFRSVNSGESLPVRYFNQSPAHQALKERIETQAAQDRAAKITERARLKQEYDDLMERAERLGHDEYFRWKKGRRWPQHSSSCHKCALSKKAQSMTINVHEWPLPEIDRKARAAVFELDVPQAISKWRDATYALLADVLGTLPGSTSNQDNYSKQKLYFLHGYEGLRGYVSSNAGRLQLGSIAKSFLVAHYRNQNVSVATPDSICKNHNLQYKAYDTTRHERPPGFFNLAHVRKACTFRLAKPGPLDSLQYVLDSTFHTTNEVIASQRQHPVSLTLHESYVFASLRSGHRLQWRNIARELAARVLNFNRLEAHMLIAQAAWQVGPLGGLTDCLRQSHVDLAEEEFAASVIAALKDSIGAIEANWQGASAARTYTLLVARLLSVSPHTHIQTACIDLLRKARVIALTWLRELGQKLHNAAAEKEVEALRQKTLEMALTCHESFDVDPDHLATLFAADEVVATFTECSIAVRDHCHAHTDGLPEVLMTLLRRYWRRMHRCEISLRERIIRSSDGLDTTVQRLWAGYTPGRPWFALEKPNERWLVTMTSTGDGSKTVTVHYNVLDGGLLVNGSPLTRLPKSYEADSSYHRVFGERVFDVIPSTMTGMLFETRDKVYGYQIYFGLHQSKLIIQAKKDDRKYELIPLDTLSADFPYAFSNEYLHWLDMQNGIIEWRPLTDPWNSSELNWQMRIESDGSRRLAHESLKLIDLRAPTAKALASVFSPLEQASHIHITLHDVTGLLEVHMPHLKLDFFLSTGSLHLESKQYRGMVVDDDQSFGALTGLVHKLVLRAKRGSSRVVIVPHGEVSFNRDGHHACVQVSQPTQHSRSYHVYNVDTILGRLVENGSLYSKLFLSYLHAVTSNCLPDMLTSRTGTEEALSILRSASAHSFLRIEEEETHLLEQIAHLTPVYEYYPPGRHKNMQRIHWTNLPVLSQHPAFDRSVRSIVCHAESFNLFNESQFQIANSRDRGEPGLLQRAVIRDSSYRAHSFGAEDYTTNYDETYAARDMLSAREREFQVYSIAKLVEEWSRDLRCTNNLLLKIMAWGAPIHGISDEASFDFGFDLQWLLPPREFFPARWCNLQKFLSTSTTADKYKIMLFLSLLSYSKHRDVELIETLLAFTTVPELRALLAPPHDIFDLAQGFEPRESKLLKLAKRRTRPFEDCPECTLPQRSDESWDDLEARRAREYSAAKGKSAKLFVECATTQWPADTVCVPYDKDWCVYFQMKEAFEDVQVQFNIWHHNVDFQRYTTSAQQVLNSLSACSRPEDWYAFSARQYQPSNPRRSIGLEDLFRNDAPIFAPNASGKVDSWLLEGGGSVEDDSHLQALLTGLSSASSTSFMQRYIQDLGRSFESLSKNKESTLRRLQQGIEGYAEKHAKRCDEHLQHVHQAVISTLSLTPSIALRIVHAAGTWPRLSQRSLLQCLTHVQRVILGKGWRDCLTTYGLAIADFQHAERLVAAIGNTAELLSEIRTPGRQGWDPTTYPDWLLFEIENNLRIRPVQAQIANEMILPASKINSIMQLNMGEGKSSVIVPIVVAALADGKKLIRVVVLKPLAPQMFHSLVTKLGGLLNRRIFYMPFSRSLRFDHQQALQIRQLYKECMSTGGVLLTQPEHLLSFELMGPERLLASAPEVGKAMVKTQRWLDTHSRDILDESDEILSVRFELTYTMGKQAMIEFGPDRWLIIQHVLGLLRSFADQVAKKFPDGLEVFSTCAGGFPRIRVLQACAGEELTTMIAHHICEQGIPSLPVWNRDPDTRRLLFRYLTDDGAKVLQPDLVTDKSIQKTLLLLRGLIAGRILNFAFEQKRWRVNYGLDLSRTMLSVPYRAKDIPAARAEFSHPDTTIVLTCLSYYYGGLSDQELYTAFDILLQSDQGQSEYDGWIQDAPNMPAAFRQLVGINLADGTQCRKVFSELRFAKGAVDFYMSRVVFPREMQEFPEKLSSSGWDIAKAKAHPITGFSGTNDSRYILPLSVSQCDLEEQLHTNAAVLNCLLRSENTFQNSSTVLSMEIFDAESLLDLVIKSEPPIRVVLDVGAQVLELTNEEVARKWLSKVEAAQAQAAVFFDHRNELSVLDRDGTVESFLISPFAKQMDQCLVYLDESHTRGTDLKLPTDYRAAVTLGPTLTKDQLVQACMRMRKLGKGQSVMFCAPKEIERKIIQCTGKSDDSTITVPDVLRWSIHETCSSTKKGVPLWAIQGIRHQRRQLAWSNSIQIGDSGGIDAAKRLLEPEVRSLEERYGSKQEGLEEQLLLHARDDESFGVRKEQIKAIRDNCRDFGIRSFSSAKLQEEQERELSPENEKERQVERPPPATALEHNVHGDVKKFV